MNIRTTLPIAAIAAAGLTLAGCVAPATRVTQLQPSQQQRPQLAVTTLPKVQPLPELPEVQLPVEREAGGVATRDWLPGVDLSKILINPVGPEADPYLQHYPPVLIVPSSETVLEAPAWIEPLMPVGSDAGTNPVNPWGTEPATSQADAYWQQYLPASEPSAAPAEEPASIEPLMPIYSDAGTNPVDPWVVEPASIEPLMPVGSDAGTNPVNPWVTEPTVAPVEPYWQQYVPPTVAAPSPWQPAYELPAAPAEEPASIEPLMPIYSDAGTNPVDPWVVEPASIEPLMPVGSDAGTNPVNPWVTEPTGAPQSLWLPGTDLRQIDLTQPGPEADPTLQHLPQAIVRATDWLPGTDLRQIDLMQPGPEADPTLQHYTGPLPVRTQPSWLPGVDLRTVSIAPVGPPSELALAHRESVTPTPWLPGVDLRLIDLTVPGPEADPYLQHRAG